MQGVPLHPAHIGGDRDNRSLKLDVISEILNGEVSVVEEEEDTVEVEYV